MSFSHRWCLAGLSATCVLLASCTPALMDAAAYAATKNTDAPGSQLTGNEIIGVWTSSEGLSGSPEVLLFRPDGTGRDRTIDNATQKVVEWTFAWHYEGRGTWAGKHLDVQEIKPAPTTSRKATDARRFTVRLIGGSLRREAGGRRQAFTRS